MKRFLLEPGRQLVEECLVFLCSILEQPSSHPIPHPHCFLPNYGAINQIKPSKKKRNTNELKGDKRKEKRSGKLSEKNGFIPGGVSWKIWVWLFRWGLTPPPLQRRTNSNNLLPQLYSPSPGPHLSPEVKSMSLFQQVFFIFEKNSVSRVANRESLAKLSCPLFLDCLSISRDREIMYYFWSGR